MRITYKKMPKRSRKIPNPSDKPKGPQWASSARSFVKYLFENWAQTAALMTFIAGGVAWSLGQFDGVLTAIAEPQIRLTQFSSLGPLEIHNTSRTGLRVTTIVVESDDGDDVRTFDLMTTIPPHSYVHLAARDIPDLVAFNDSVQRRFYFCDAPRKIVDSLYQRNSPWLRVAFLTTDADYEVMKKANTATCKVPSTMPCKISVRFQKLGEEAEAARVDELNCEAVIYGPQTK